jgi:Cof subfamily protein (haloacid dehalogenase superfamily)
MEIRLVAVDLDDTLLDRTRQISPRARHAIRCAVQQGVTVTIATGRMFCSAQPYAAELDLDVPLITYNGALIKCSKTGKTVLHRPLDSSTAAEVLGLFRQRGWYIQAYVDDVLYVKERDAKARYYEEIASVTAVPVGERLYSLNGAPTKLLAVAEPEEMQEIAASVRQSFGDRVYIAASKAKYLEITNPEVNKGWALAFLAERLGISRAEVMAVGDSLNDLDMVSYAGLGVAMGNAHDEVKAAASAVTSANDADGVAEAIEKYVLYTAGGQ